MGRLHPSWVHFAGFFNIEKLNFIGHSCTERHRKHSLPNSSRLRTARSDLMRESKGPIDCEHDLGRSYTPNLRFRCRKILDMKGIKW